MMPISRKSDLKRDRYSATVLSNKNGDRDVINYASEPNHMRSKSKLQINICEKFHFDN